jgi:D-threo-aldose 1-dehydrogenase
MTAIKMRRIGSAGTRVTSFGLGGTGLGNMYQAVEEDAALELVAAAYQGGVRYFDTAPCYGLGLSETRLGRALAGLKRSRFAVSTKVGYSLVPLAPGEDSWTLWDKSPPMRAEFDFSYDAAMRSIDGSLERLNLDNVDMVAIHDPDEAAGNDPSSDPYSRSHFKEAMDGAYRALHSLRNQRMIGAIGVGINQWQMLTDFAREGDFDYFLLAGRYTLLDHASARTLLPLCLERGVKVIVGGPFNSGILASGAVSGAYYNYAPAPADVLNRVRRIESLCARSGISLRAAALQFPLGHPAVVSVIPGARSTTEFDENIAALGETIPQEFWASLKAERLIDESVPVPPLAAAPAASPGIS